MTESYLTFKGKSYKGTRGMTMVNPISPVLSDIFVDKIKIDLHTKT